MLMLKLLPRQREATAAAATDVAHGVMYPLRRAHETLNCYCRCGELPSVAHCGP